MLFITATDTDVGKTFFSKSLINHLVTSGAYDRTEIAYFKAVQCGEPTDFDEIKKETGIDIYCSYNLAYPASPDYAASLESIEISLEKIKTDFDELKTKYKFIVVEGAGGAAVPLNKKETVADLINLLGIEAVLVIRPDLGTINHSLITVDYLKAKAVDIKGLFVSAKSRELSEAYNVSVEDKKKQNDAAIESIKRFSGLQTLELSDFA